MNIYSLTVLQRISTRIASVNLYLDCFSESLPGISPWNNYLDPSFNLQLDCFNESLSHYFSESLSGIRTCTASVNLYLDPLMWEESVESRLVSLHNQRAECSNGGSRRHLGHRRILKKTEKGEKLPRVRPWLLHCSRIFYPMSNTFTNQYCTGTH
jgi:hypothetical protein